MICNKRKRSVSTSCPTVIIKSKCHANERGEPERRGVCSSAKCFVSASEPWKQPLIFNNSKMPAFSAASNEFGIEISQSLSKLSGEIDLLVNYFWLNDLNWWTGSYQRVVFAWKSRWNVGCISFRGGCFYSFPSGRLLLSEFSDLINEAALVTSYSLSLHFSFKTWMFE